MNNISQYIIRLTNPKGNGGGFIFHPKEADDFAYIITARHCVVDRETDIAWKKEELSVTFLSQAVEHKYELTDSDIIVFGGNNATEDIAILLIPGAALPASITIASAPKLCHFPGSGSEIEITGIPSAVNYEFIRTLYNLNVLSDKDYNNQIQIEVSDPIVEHYNSDVLVEGYSGSPILVFSREKVYYTGIFLAYEENTRRILGIDLVLVKRLLGKIGKGEIKLEEIETDSSIFKDLEKLKNNTNRILSRIRLNIGTLNLERADLTDKAVKQIGQPGLTMITGKPGSGKSAITKQALSHFILTHEIFAIQGEQLDRPSIEQIFSQEPFMLDNGLQKIFDSPACLKRKIVLIDSVEKVLETGNAETILDFFELLSKREDVTLVLTCRSYAVEQLKIRFLRHFPAFPPFEVPLLSEAEVLSVADIYPVVKQLLQNSALAKVLDIPFNLDKATILPAEPLQVGVDSEASFRELMWEYVIEGRDRIHSASIRKQRGEAFSRIAIQRAAAMSPYTSVTNIGPEIIEALIADNIIDPEPVYRQSHAAAHDIYEDWAITRYIQIGYQAHLSTSGSQALFFEGLGSSPSIRRAFRLWVSGLIQTGASEIKELLTLTLQDQDVPNHWKDEIIIAAMQSPYSKEFLNENKDLLFTDKFKYFKRVVFLLKVACQEPDFSLINNLEPSERLKLYHNINLKPFGEGWPNLIEFIRYNLQGLKSQMHLIFMILMNWEKGLSDYKALPHEARSAGLILLRYYELYANEEKFRGKRKTFGVKTDDGILLLFRLTEVIRDELKTLIETSFRYSRVDDDYKVGSLYRKIIDNVLDGHESMRVCLHLPELVIEIAEKKWFYYPPTKEEIEKMILESPFRSLPGDGIYKESNFGLKENTHMSYFPASPNQTPVLNLLYAAPYKTLDFVIKMLNHVTDSYVKSNYGIGNEFVYPKEVRSVVEITMRDGKPNQQHASAILWMAYRGTTVAIPNLLQSVLMALESYLISIGKDISERSDGKYKDVLQKVWDTFFETLLSKSNNVMTTAVLLSVTHAYRDLAGKHMLPVLKVRQVYDWDLLRAANERRVLSPAGGRKNAYRRQKALYEFNHLKHRNHNIIELVMQLSQGALKKDIYEILDHFYSEDPTDENWRFMLARMDLRVYKIVKEVENGFIVEPELAKDLREKVEIERKVQENINPVLNASMWAIKKQKNETVEADNYEQWALYFPSVRDGELNFSIHKYHKNTGAFAAIGIRDFLNDMREEELKWSRKKVMDIVNYQLFNRQRYDIDLDYSSFEIEGAFYSLPILLIHCKGGERNELRQAIFYALLFLEDKFSRDMLIQSINERLWIAEPDFVTCCIESMVKYCEVSHLRHILINRSLAHESSGKITFFIKAKKVFKKIQRWFHLKRKNMPVEQSNEQWYREKEQLFNETFQKVLSVILQGIPVGMEAANFIDGGTWHLFEALRIIPADTEIPGLRDFYSRMLGFILEYINSERESYNDKLHYELRQRFEEKFALFLLMQPESISKEFLGQLTGWVYEPEYKRQFRDKRYEFVEKCLDQVIRKVIESEEHTSSFWKLWEYLAQKSLASRTLHFDTKLLLDDIFFGSSQQDWKPLEGKKDFFRPLIKGKGNLSSALKLISGIGFKELMPEAIEWLAGRIEEHSEEAENPLIYFEKIIIQGYYDGILRKMISSNQKSRTAFIKILDALIDRSASSSAYIIREDFISQKA